ncbi:MAG: aminopeptidase P family protein [Actinobacteria bacterium]|nr:aminopeptidase P family protein [Actinomycetota bacterium]
MEEYLSKRIQKLRKKLDEINIKNYLIFKDENIFYLTGFYSKDSGSILVVTDKEIYLLIHFIYYELAKKTSSISSSNIIQYISDRHTYLESIFKYLGYKIIAAEGNNISYENFLKISKTAKKQKKILKNLPGIVEEMRAVKDESEILKIQNCCSITDKIMKNLFEMNISKLKKYTEIELSYFIENEMVKMKSTGSSFEFVVASNENSSLPHHNASHKKIDDGILLIDAGCRFENYCSDITRTVFLGKDGYSGKNIKNKFSPGKNIRIKNNIKIKEIYDIVLQAQLKALDACRAGITCRELDSVARKYIKKKGYGKNFGHGLGHGIGLEVHENPKISFSDNSVLGENMVITIEPGIYLEGIGGVRIEDMVIVKKNGCVNLYKSPKIYTIIN